jgi:two-component system, LytTR family, sensor kinase
MDKDRFLKKITYLPVILAVAIFLIDLVKDCIGSAITFFDLLKSIVMIAWFLGTFYFFYFFMVKKFLKQEKIVKYFIVSVIACFIISVSVFYLIELIKIIFRYETIRLSLKGWTVYSFYTACIGGLAMLYRFSIDWFINLNLEKKLENLKLKNEIAQLKSKLNPHFLFNTLNNIDTMIETDTKNASEYLGKLSSILRYVIYDTEKEVVDLDKELKCIKDYIDLQKIRLPRKKMLVLSIKGETKGLKIAPSLLLPFIENIFKHADLKNEKCNTTIAIKVENSTLEYNSENYTRNDNFDNTTRQKETGIGIETTKKRLELLYGGFFTLDIKTVDNRFNVNLKINLNEDRLHNNRR